MSARARRMIGWIALAVLAASVTAGAGSPAAVAASDAGSGAGRMMLVLDSSGSMKEPAGGGMTKIAAAKKALDQVVAGLPAEAEVGMRVYGATVFSKADAGACRDSQEAVGPGTSNRDQLRAAIAKYKPYGETPTGYALREAARDLGSEGKRSIVLVSDGEATCAPDPCVVASELARQGVNLHIDVVGLGVSGQARRQLQCVAAQGNGTYYGVDSADEIVSSLSRVAGRDVRPFTLEGTPIKGSLDEQMPVPITQGVWTDVVPAYQAEKNTLHYVYTRRMSKSAVHVSALTLGQPDSEDTIAVSIRTAAGESCDKANDLRQLVRFGALGAQAISQTGPDNGAEGPCATAGKLLIDVSRDMGLSQQAAPVQILVAEEQPVDDAAALPPAFDGRASVPAPGAGTTARPVTGGTSFPDATEVGPGTYSGTTVPGEASMFRVHVGWGQRLAVRFDFPRASGTLAKLVGYQGPFADTQIYDPLRTPISDLIHGSQGTHFASSSASSGHVDAATYPVRYRNRSTVATYSALAGDYYVGLNVARDLEKRTYELPYTMQVEVIGTPSGAPAYARDAGWSVDTALAGKAPSTGPATAAPRARKQGSGSDATKYVAAGGLGLVAICCAGVGVLLLRRRQS